MSEEKQDGIFIFNDNSSDSDSGDDEISVVRDNSNNPLPNREIPDREALESMAPKFIDIDHLDVSIGVFEDLLRAEMKKALKPLLDELATLEKEHKKQEQRIAESERPINQVRGEGKTHFRQYLLQIKKSTLGDILQTNIDNIIKEKIANLRSEYTHESTSLSFNLNNAINNTCKEMATKIDEEVCEILKNDGLMSSLKKHRNTIREIPRIAAAKWSAWVSASLDHVWSKISGKEKAGQESFKQKRQYYYQLYRPTGSYNALVSVRKNLKEVEDKVKHQSYGKLFDASLKKQKARITVYNNEKENMIAAMRDGTYIPARNFLDNK